MKRVALNFAFILVICIIATLNLSTKVPLIFLFLSVVGIIIFKIFKNSYKYSKFIVGICSLLLVASIFCVTYFTLLVSPVNALIDKSATITATVIEQPKYENNLTVLTVKTNTIATNSAVPQGVKLRLYSEEKLNIDIYDSITADVNFYDFDNQNKEAYFKDNIYVGAYFVTKPQITKSDSNSGIYSSIIIARERLIAKLRQYFTFDTAGIVGGLLIGDISLLSDRSFNAFKDSGILHLMAVSGAHISIICSVILKAFGRFGLGRREAAIVTLPIIILFTAIVGFAPSAVRATIMYIIFLIGIIIFKNGDTLNSLGISISAMLLYNPFTIYDLGFLLSVFCCFGLVIFEPRIKEIIKNILFAKRHSALTNAIAALLSQAISATIAILPISIADLGVFSLVSPFTNLLVIYASVADMALSVIVAIIFIFPVSLPIGAFTSTIEIISFYILKIAEIAAASPIAKLNLNSSTSTTWFIGICLFIILSYVIFKRLNLKNLAIFATAFLIFVTVLGKLDFNKNQISIYSNSNSCGIVLQTKRYRFLLANDANIPYNMFKGVASDGNTPPDISVVPIKSLPSFENLYQTDLSICKITNSSYSALINKSGLNIDASSADGYCFDDIAVEFYSCSDKGIAVTVNGKQKVCILKD